MKTEKKTEMRRVKSLLMTLCTGLAVFMMCMLPSIGSQAAAEEMNLMKIATPSEATSMGISGTRRVFEFTSTKDSYTGRFTLQEAGYVFFIGEESSGNDRSWFRLYDNAAMEKELIAVNGYSINTPCIYRKEATSWFLDAGTYYVKASPEAPSTLVNYSFYADGFFLPISTVFSSLTEDKADCENATLTLAYGKSGSSQMYVGDVSTYRDLGDRRYPNLLWDNNWHDAEKSATDIYSVHANGTYTFKVTLDGAEWVKYPFLVRKNVTDLPGHAYDTIIAKKATTSADGLIRYKCRVCNYLSEKTTVINKVNDFSLSQALYTYNGKAKKPAVYVKDSVGNVVGAGNYKVTYKNNIKVGTAKVTVKLDSAKYSGSKELTFKIVPKKSSIKKLSSTKNSVKVTWKKVTDGVNGYELQCSRNASFSSKKKLEIKSKSATNATFTGLKKSSTYYVRIRTYKTVSGKKVYSEWSAVKTIRTKSK